MSAPFREAQEPDLRAEIDEIVDAYCRSVRRMADNVIALACEDAVGADLEGGITAALKQRAYACLGGDHVHRALVSALRGAPVAGFVSSFDLGVAMKERLARNEVAAVRGGRPADAGSAETDADRAGMRAYHLRGEAMLASVALPEFALAAGV